MNIFMQSNRNCFHSMKAKFAVMFNVRRHCRACLASVDTLLSSGSGLLKDTYSVPTHDTIPKPLGLTPAAGVSVSSLSFSTAYIARFRL